MKTFIHSLIIFFAGTIFPLRPKQKRAFFDLTQSRQGWPLPQNNLMHTAFDFFVVHGRMALAYSIGLSPEAIKKDLSWKSASKKGNGVTGSGSLPF